VIDGGKVATASGHQVAVTEVMMFKKILCPVDFSEPSRYAMRSAAQLAIDTGAELVVAHAWESPLHPEYSELILKNDAFAPVLKKEEDALAAIKRELEGLGPKSVQAKLLFGVPWHAIVEESRKDPTYDVIVMGTHGRSGIKHVLLGSVAERVARHASCPVLLIRSKGTAS
jgi:nucleotide-binding universal stress UspA family protein